jgi:hypothetical protein
VSDSLALPSSFERGKKPESARALDFYPDRLVSVFRWCCGGDCGHPYGEVSGHWWLLGTCSVVEWLDGDKEWLF